MLPQLAHCWHKYLLYDMCAALHSTSVTQKQRKMLLFVPLFLSSSFSEHPFGFFFLRACDSPGYVTPTPILCYICFSSPSDMPQLKNRKGSIFSCYNPFQRSCLTLSENLPRVKRTDLKWQTEHCRKGGITSLDSRTSNMTMLGQTWSCAAVSCDLSTYRICRQL